MKVSFAATLAIAGLVGGSAFARSSLDPRPVLQEGHGLGDPKIEYRMRIAREDAQQEKMHDAADEIGRLATGLAEKVSRGDSLGTDDSRALDRIKRLAKRMRSDLGGGRAATLEEKPESVADAWDALGACGAELANLVSRSNRFVVDARAIRLAGELIVLADILKEVVR